MDNRLDAIANGNKRYSTGKACRRGHMGERYTNSGLCIDCVRANADKRAAQIKKANILRNTQRMEPARVYRGLVRPQHHPMFDALANITIRGTPDQIAQCAAFIQMINSQI